jgi:hypothetical protein
VKFHATITASPDVSEELNASFIRATRIGELTGVRFEVFTAVTMKNGVFWVVTP